ncbi:MAG: histidine kinase [Bacteroidia bacterium]|nr:histidine kinase [Bacteroidia bacterium]MDW8016024.1 histidine kinase [Bacteroidia bacterium]
MEIQAVYVGDAPDPGQGTRIPSLPPHPAPRTVYLIPSGYPRPKRPFPILSYQPSQAARFPDRYYDPATLTPTQLLLAWRTYKLRLYKRFRWRIALLRKAPSIYYFAFDDKKRLIDFNPAFERAMKLLGRPLPRLGKSIAYLPFSENRVSFLEEVRLVLQGQAVQSRRAVGPYEAEAHLLPLSRRRRAFAYYAVDVTQNRHLLEVSIVQQALYETIVKHLREGIVLLDINRHILYLNPAAQRLLGEEAEGWVGNKYPLPLDKEVIFHRDRPIRTTTINLEEGLLLILRDFSELWHAVQKRELLQKAIEEAPFGILLLRAKNADYESLYHNKTFSEWLMSNGEDPFTALVRHIPLSERTRLKKRLERKEAFHILLRRAKSQRGWTHVQAIFFPIYLSLIAGEEDFYWAVVLQDQSEIYRAALQRHRLERRQQQLILEAQEKERQHLAEELHDNLGMLLSVLKMELSTLLSEVRADPALRMKLQALSQRLDEVVQTVRLTSHQLMPPLVEHFGLVSSLESLIRRLQSTSGLQINLKVEGEEIPLPFIKMLQVYRILQELIMNTLRHAEARHLHLYLAYQKRRLFIEVWDDGRGYEPSALHGRGIGLYNIVGRLQVLGGRWENLSAPGRGAHYQIEVPLPRKKS